MKKLLSLLGAISLTATGASGVVACKKPEIKNKKEDKTKPTEETKKEQEKIIKTLQKVTDQQFADEIAKIINNKKYIFLSNDDLIKDHEIIKTLKGFIKEIKIDKFDTSEFDKAKITFENIDAFYNTSREKKIRDIIIKYNNIKSNTKINLEFK